MRFFALIPALAALVTSVASVSIRDGTGLSEIDAGSSSKRNLIELPTRATDGLTNAELLRRGLPLKNPIMRRGAFILWL